jgi:Short-chain alcohol dehydrogenase of unknown specificity
MSDTVLIAGVGPTIGAAAARVLHQAGYDVGLFARSPSLIDDLAAELGTGAVAVPTDITDPAAVTAGVETVRESLGPIKALILNATAGAGSPVAEASLKRLRSMFEVRVVASLACVQAVQTDLESTGGTVLFSGTSFATGSVTEQIEWGAVAPAAQGLARSLASALVNVQVTYVRIGSRVDQTAATDALSATSVAEAYRELIQRETTTTRVCDLRARD